MVTAPCAPLPVTASGVLRYANRKGSPDFISTELLNPKFYRIGANSAARDSVDPAAMLDVDIDGEARDDERRDMGADEYKE